MKISSEIMKAAHKLTKEIKAEFAEVDYKTQLGICIKFLINKGEKEMEIKKMSIEELKVLQASIRKELENREDKKVVYTHDCKDAAKYHLGKYKHWMKLLTGIDTSKTNGYAFQGEFLGVTSEHKLKVGSITVECCGSDITAYKVIDDSENDNKEEIGSCSKNSMCSLIEKLSKLF